MIMMKANDIHPVWRSFYCTEDFKKN